MSNNIDGSDSDQEHHEIILKINEIIECLKIALDFKDDQIQELRQYLQNSTAENVELNDLLQVCQSDDAEQKKRIAQLEQDLKEVRRKRDKFKEDAQESRDENDRLRVIIDKLMASLRSISLSLQGIVPVAKQEDQIVELIGPIEAQATGAFIYCVSDDLAKRHDRYFEKLKLSLPTVDFSNNNIRILSDSERPPIPQVDVILILYDGLTHPDGVAIRGTIRSMEPPPQIISGKAISDIIVNTIAWLTKRAPATIAS